MGSQSTDNRSHACRAPINGAKVCAQHIINFQAHVERPSLREAPKMQDHIAYGYVFAAPSTPDDLGAAIPKMLTVAPSRSLRRPLGTFPLCDPEN